MIIQSSNKPIILEFTENIENTNIHNSFRATLWDKNKNKLKTWTKENSIVHENLIELSLTQIETAEYTEYVELEVKWLNEDNKTEFTEIETIYIKNQKDKDELEV